MQLLKPFINDHGSCKTKPNAKQSKAKAEHEAWLRRNGVHPDQLKHSRLSKKTFKTEQPTKISREEIPLSNKIVDGGRATGIMANLHKESAATRAAILEKASRAVPLYNKGGLQLLSKNEDMTKIGSLSRRG